MDSCIPRRPSWAWRCRPVRRSSSAPRRAPSWARVSASLWGHRWRAAHQLPLVVVGAAAGVAGTCSRAWRFAPRGVARGTPGGPRSPGCSRTGRTSSSWWRRRPRLQASRDPSPDPCGGTSSASRPLRTCCPRRSPSSSSRLLWCWFCCCLTLPQETLRESARCFFLFVFIFCAAKGDLQLAARWLSRREIVLIPIGWEIITEQIAWLSLSYMSFYA